MEREAAGAGLDVGPTQPHVAATFEPDARIDYVFVGPPGGDVLGQVFDTEPFGTEPVAGVWTSDHFGVLAVLRGRSICGDGDSVSHGGPTSETGN